MYCEFTKNLIFHDFDDVLEDPFRFPITYITIRKNFKNRQA